MIYKILECAFCGAKHMKPEHTSSTLCPTCEKIRQYSNKETR